MKEMTRTKKKKKKTFPDFVVKKKDRRARLKIDFQRLIKVSVVREQSSCRNDNCRVTNAIYGISRALMSVE